MAGTDALLGTAILRAVLDKSGYDTSLSSLKRDTENQLSQLQRSFTDTMNNISAITGRWGVGLSAAITTPLTLVGRAGLTSAMQLETFSASLNVIIGDAERANRVFEDLYEFSANTPFDWRSLSNATVVLAAFGSEAEDILPQLQMIGDIAAGIQTPIDELARLFGRVQIAGRVTMEDVNSLAARGVPIYTELAKQFNVTTGEVRDLVSAGMVGFGNLNRMFIELTSEGGKFFGMMDAQSEVTAGKWARLKDSFEQVTDLIGERLLPIVNDLIAIAQSATEWFVNLDESLQTMIITTGLGAAAIGPLMLGISGLTKVLGGLAAAMATPFGPAGLIVLAITGITAFLMHLDRLAKSTTDYAGAAEKLGVAIRQATEAQDAQLLSAVNARQALRDLENATNENGVMGAVNALADALQGEAKVAMTDFAVSTIAPMVQQGRLQEAINQTILKFIELRIQANQARIETLQGLREEVESNISAIEAQIEGINIGQAFDDLEYAVAEAQDRIVRGYGELSGYGLRVIERDGRKVVEAFIQSTGEAVTSFRVGMEPLLDEVIRFNTALGNFESPMVSALRNALIPFTEQLGILDAELEPLLEQTNEYIQLQDDLATGTITAAEAIKLLDEDLAEIFTRFDVTNNNLGNTGDVADNTAEKIVTLSSVLADLRNGLENVKTMSQLVGDEFDAATTTADLFRAAAESLIENGLVPATTNVDELIEALQRLVDTKEVVEDTFDVIGGSIRKLAADLETGRQETEAIEEQLRSLREGIQSRIAEISEGGITSREELEEYVKLAGQLSQVNRLLEDIQEKNKPLELTPRTAVQLPPEATRQKTMIDAEWIRADTERARADAIARGDIVPLEIPGLEIIIQDAPTALAMFEMLRRGYTDFREVVEEPLGPPGGIPEYLSEYVDYAQHQIATAANNASDAERIMVDTVQGMVDSIEAAREAGDQPLFDTLVKDAQAYVDRLKDVDGLLTDQRAIDLVSMFPEEVTGATVPLTLTPSVDYNEVTTEVDKILAELNDELERAALEARLFGEESELASRSQNILLNAVRQLLDAGLDPSSDEIQNIIALYFKYQSQIDAAAQAKKDEAEAARQAAEAQRALNAAQEKYDALQTQILQQAGLGASVFDQMRDDLTALAKTLDISSDELEYLLDLIDQLEAEQGVQDTFQDISKYVGIAGDILGGFVDLLDGDLLGGVKGVAVGVGELIGTLSGIPGVGQLVGQVFDTIIGVLGDLGNGLEEVNAEIKKMQEGFSLIDVSNLVVTERVSRGGLLGWLGFTKEAINEEITGWRLQIAQGLESGFTSGISGAVTSILTGADDSIDQLQRGLEQAVTAALVDAVINSAIVGGMLGPWLEALTLAISTGDFDTARSIVAQIQAQLPAIAAALDEILEPFRGIFTPDPEELEEMVENLNPLNPRYEMGLDFALPPSIQLAIATPLLESANAFGLHVAAFGDTVDVFNTAVNRAVPIITSKGPTTRGSDTRLVTWR